MTDRGKTINVLFLCTGNSCRSILAECILNGLGRGRFAAYSAGSRPAGTVNPRALALLARLGYPLEGLRSKQWDEFARPGAPEMDIIITTCDDAAGEVCPIWPGHPLSAHWGVPDPAAATGSDDEIMRAFEDTYRRLEVRISDMLALPVGDMDQGVLKKCLNDIGQRRDG